MLACGSPKPVIELHVDGQVAGRLSAQTSNEYLPLVERLSAAGTIVVARAKVTGNTLQPAVTIMAARVSDLTEEWIQENLPPTAPQNDAGGHHRGE